MARALSVYLPNSLVEEKQRFNGIGRFHTSPENSKQRLDQTTPLYMLINVEKGSIDSFNMRKTHRLM